MPTGQRRRRSTRLFQQLDLVIRVSVTLNVRVDVDPAIRAFADRHQFWVRVGPVPVDAVGVTVGARVRSELRPRSGELAVQDRQRGHDQAEDEVEENPVLKANVVPWVSNASQPQSKSLLSRPEDPVVPGIVPTRNVRHQLILCDDDHQRPNTRDGADGENDE